MQCVHYSYTQFENQFEYTQFENQFVTVLIECNACQKNIQTCQLSSVIDKMYCQPAYCIDCKPTKAMNKVRTFSKLFLKDHVLVASSASNSTSHVALNAIDLNLFFNRENKQFSIPDCDIDNLSNLTEYVESHKLQTITSNNSFKNTFTVLSLNIRSIVNSFNFSKLEALLSNMNCKPDVISLTESWIQPSSSGPYKNLNVYNFVSNCRSSYKGGGVAFYVKDKFHFNICDELVEMDEKIFESLYIFENGG